MIVAIVICFMLFHCSGVDQQQPSAGEHRWAIVGQTRPRWPDGPMACTVFFSMKSFFPSLWFSLSLSRSISFFLSFFLSLVCLLCFPCASQLALCSERRSTGERSGALGAWISPIFWHIWFQEDHGSIWGFPESWGYPNSWMVRMV